jgi:glutaredoxin
MFPTVDYHVSPRSQAAPDETPDVFFYGLSFCGHCVEGKTLLQELGLEFRWTFIDLLEPDVRRPILKALRDRAGEPVNYPVLEVNGEFVFGYNRAVWSELLRSGSQKP